MSNNYVISKFSIISLALKKKKCIQLALEMSKGPKG